MMKQIAILFVSLVLTIAPALAEDYEATDKSPLCEGRLRVPAEAMAIASLKDRILALHKSDIDQAKADAKDDKEGNPHFHPYSIDTVWRVTFENEKVLSLSGDTYADTGGVHPNEAFQTIVWDKKAGQAVPIEALFAPDQLPPALKAIADAAAKAWTKIYTERAGQPPGQDSDLAETGIGADPEKLKNYALIYAKGQTSANGILLLYGAGQVWPHVIGDFRLVVPVAVFKQYLLPQWKGVFAG